MRIEGEGSGADNESCIIGDIIEEDVMYFEGRGSGEDCHTGNPSEETENGSTKSETDTHEAKQLESKTLDKLGEALDTAQDEVEAKALESKTGEKLEEALDRAKDEAEAKELESKTGEKLEEALDRGKDEVEAKELESKTVEKLEEALDTAEDELEAEELESKSGEKLGEALDTAKDEVEAKVLKPKTVENLGEALDTGKDEVEAKELEPQTVEKLEETLGPPKDELEAKKAPESKRAASSDCRSFAIKRVVLAESQSNGESKEAENSEEIPASEAPVTLKSTAALEAAPKAVVTEPTCEKKQAYTCGNNEENGKETPVVELVDVSNNGHLEGQEVVKDPESPQSINEKSQEQDPLADEPPLTANDLDSLQPADDPKALKGNLFDTLSFAF